MQVAGIAGVPSDAKALAINLTGTNTATASCASVSPSGTTATSSLNWTGQGKTVCNKVIATLSSPGSLEITKVFGSADVIMDVSEYFTGSSSLTGRTSFEGMTPVRILDTRPGSGNADEGMNLLQGKRNYSDLWIERSANKCKGCSIKCHRN